MTVQCVYCANFTLQNSDGRSGADLAKQGFGTCRRNPTTGRYESAQFERNCRMFEKVDNVTAIKRVDWLIARKHEFDNTIRAVQQQGTKK